LGRSKFFNGRLVFFGSLRPSRRGVFCGGRRGGSWRLFFRLIEDVEIMGIIPLA
jgi:hypothetical protein